MPILNFPTNPSIGDLYTINTRTYIWTGDAWSIYNSGNQQFKAVTATTVTITSATNSTSTTSGSLIVSGGIGVSGDVYIGGNYYSGGGEVLTTSTLPFVVLAGTDTQITSSTTAITISNTSTLQSVTDRGAITNRVIQITNTSSSTSTNTGALVVTGGVGIGGDVQVQGRVTSESLRILDAIFDSTESTVTNLATVVIDSYDINVYRSAKYLIQVDEGTGIDANFEVLEMLVLVNNSATVYLTQYAQITSNGPLGDFGADVQVDDLLRLYFTPYAATNKVINVLRTAMVK